MSNVAIAESAVYYGGVAVARCGPMDMAGSLDATARNLVLQVDCGPEFDMNNCQLSVYPGAETGQDTFAAIVDIGGPKCGGIEFETKGTNLLCYGTIPAQSLSGVKLENDPGVPGQVHLAGEPSLAVIGGGGQWGCPKAGSGATADWTLDVTLGAVGAAGEAADLRVVRTGIKVEGNEFQSDITPLEVSGEQMSPLTFQPASGAASIFCSTATVASENVVPAIGLDLEAKFSGCSDTIGRSVTVQMNSCSLLLYGSGEVEVSCSKPGDSIAYQMKNSLGSTVCTAALLEQAQAGATYTNLGSNGTGSVNAGLALSGLSTTTAGGFLNCGTKNGAHTDGVFEGGVSLNGGVHQPWS